MRIALLFAAVLASAAAFAVEDGKPKKRGGFTGTTPKPAVKKTEGAKSSPRAEKKKSVPTDDESAKQKTETNREPAAPPAEEKKESPAKPATVKEDAATAPKREHAPAVTVAPEEIAEFAAQPPRVQALIRAALELTKLNLTYTYGSADPAKGGMDCSGTMYCLLREQGFKDVPRDSSGQYVWARKAGPFFAVVSKSAESFEFKDLRPGDLLFWTGTYQTGREIPISHVMLYLGTEKKSKKRIMFGSSDGRSYDGVQRWGVSVFDFKMPRVDPANPQSANVDFVGYGRIPALLGEELAEAKTELEPAAVETPATTPAPAKKSSVSKGSAGPAKSSSGKKRSRNTNRD